MTERIPPELQTQLVKLQQLQDQLNRLLAEKNVIDSELREVNKILQELSQLAAGTPVYKIVGNLLVKTDKETIQKELDDRKELLELRSKTYQKQENLLRTQLEDLQKKVNELLSKYYPQSGGAVKA